MSLRKGAGLAALCAGLLLPVAVRAGVSARVVDGQITFAHPEVGALLIFSDEEGGFEGGCTGTLIGCRTVLLAAHCVCPSGAEDATSCLDEGTTEPESLRVFLPNGGIVAVDSVAIHPGYTFAERGDAALLHLGAEVTGIHPALVNTVAKPPAGTPGTVVGYGSTGGFLFFGSDYGVKREGSVNTATCAEGIPNATHVCWTHDGTTSSTCSGDSGGPLLLDLGEGLAVAGVISGSESFDCAPPDQVFTTDVFVIGAALATAVGDDLGRSCGDEGFVGDAEVEVTGFTQNLDSASTSARFQVSVPPGTARLRLGLNGRQASGGAFDQIANDFDLYVKAGSPPTTSEADCRDESFGAFGFCEIAAPAAGTWHVLITRVQGEGPVQATATAFAPGLVGDANCDDHLGAADLIGLASAIGTGDASCSRADANHDEAVDAADGEVILARLFE